MPDDTSVVLPCRIEFLEALFGWVTCDRAKMRPVGAFLKVWGSLWWCMKESLAKYSWDVSFKTSQECLFVCKTLIFFPPLHCDVKYIFETLLGKM